MIWVRTKRLGFFPKAYCRWTLFCSGANSCKSRYVECFFQTMWKLSVALMSSVSSGQAACCSWQSSSLDVEEVSTVSRVVPQELSECRFDQWVCVQSAKIFQQLLKLAVVSSVWRRSPFIFDCELRVNTAHYECLFTRAFLHGIFGAYKCVIFAFMRHLQTILLTYKLVLSMNKHFTAVYQW